MTKQTARTAARLSAVQAIYELGHENNQGFERSVENFLDHFNKFYLNDPDLLAFSVRSDHAHFKCIVKGVFRKKADIDNCIRNTLTQNYSFDRLSLITKSILRASVFELMEEKSIPLPVVLNEYIEISKLFLPPSDISLINGILDAISKKIRV